MVCGKEYEWCPKGCKGSDPAETWRTLFDSGRCKTVYEIWQQYRGKQINKEEAKTILRQVKVNDFLSMDSILVPVIKEILDIVEKPVVTEEPVTVEEEVSDEEKASETVAEDNVEETAKDEEPDYVKVESKKKSPKKYKATK